MGRSEEIARLVRDAGGVASAAQITEAGFLPGSISHALKSGAIDKLTRGVYCSPEVLDDEFAAVTYRWRKCVLSHGSALYLAGLSDRVPGALDASVGILLGQRERQNGCTGRESSQGSTWLRRKKS